MTPRFASSPSAEATMAESRSSPEGRSRNWIETPSWKSSRRSTIGNARCSIKVIGSSEGLAVPETFEEGHLRFRFDSSWYAIKYDEHPDYRERIERLDGTKAVDFVAVHRDSQLFLIEVKDFRGHRIENQPRLREG